METEVLLEMWNSIKFEIQEKNRVSVLKNILLTFEDHGILNEDILRSLYRENDKHFHEAVEILYKDIDMEFEEDEDLEDFE